MIRFVKIHGGQNKKGSQDVIPDAPYHDMCYVFKKGADQSIYPLRVPF